MKIFKSIKFLNALYACSALVCVQDVVLASAAHETASLQVTATLQNSCTISTSPVNFGNITNPTVDTSATGSVTHKCTNGLTGFIGLSAGLGSGATVNLRKLRSVTDSNVTINYDLAAVDPFMYNSNAWGDTPGVNAKPFTGTGQNVTETIFGSIARGQSVSRSGEFSDTVTVTMYY